MQFFVIAGRLLFVVSPNSRCEVNMKTFHPGLILGRYFKIHVEDLGNGEEHSG